LILEGDHQIDVLAHEGQCGRPRCLLVGLVPVVEVDVLALLVTQPLEALPQRRERGRIVVEADVEEPDPPHLPHLLRLGVERRGEGTGQRGQQEAAAVHAGMVGRMRAKVNQPTSLLWPRLSRGRSWHEPPERGDGAGGDREHLQERAHGRQRKLELPRFRGR
jgi:hypothetical protein